MNSLYKRLELLANIAIITVALLLGIVLVKHYLLSSSSPSAIAVEPQIKAGMKVTLPNEDWASSEQTLLLVLSKDCHFCTESASFYQRLARERARGMKARLIAVFPQSVEDGKQYLDQHDIQVDEIRQSLPTALGARGTPTLILTNSAGVVTNFWVGKLPTEKEAEVLSQLGL